MRFESADRHDALELNVRRAPITGAGTGIRKATAAHAARIGEGDDVRHRRVDAAGVAPARRSTLAKFGLGRADFDQQWMGSRRR
jgi:hypothetical protein